MMKKLAIAFSGFVLTAAAAPDVTITSAVQDPETRVVNVEYNLTDGPAIVTLDVLSGDDPVSPAPTHLAGAVSRKVASGNHTFTWIPEKDGFTAPLSSVKLKLTAWSPSSPPDYMVIDLVSPTNTWYYTGADSVPLGVSNAVYKTSRMLFRKIPAANVKWLQGSATPVATTGEQTNRWCTLTADYYMGVYEVSGRQYANVMGTVVGDRTLADWDIRPVVSIAFIDLRGITSAYDWPQHGHNVSSASFFGRLRSLCGQQADLPTGAQWEYACRAGTSTPLYGELDDIAWHVNSGVTVPQPCGGKAANEWGLYDMIGNVFEYCLDWMSTAAETDSADVTDPEGPEECEPMSTRGDGGRMWRGGTFKAGYAPFQSVTGVYTWGHPGTSYDFVGFRVCCPME